MGNSRNIHQEKLWNKNLILIIFANCCSSMSFQILMPTLPLFVQQQGYKEAIIGVVVGILTLTTIVLRPFTGIAMDSWNRKGLLLIGMSIIMVSIFSYQFSLSIVTLIIFRLIHGIGWGIVTTATSTIAADVIPKSRLGEGIGYYGLSTVFSLAIAPAFGLYIVNTWSFTHLFTLASFLTLLGFIFSLLIKYKEQSEFSSNGELQVQVASQFFEKTAFLPSLLNLCMSLTLSAIVTFISLYALQLDIHNIGIFFTIYAVTLLIIRPLSGYLADRKGFTYVLFPGIIAVIIALISIAYAKTLLAFIIAAIFYGIGWGTVHPSLQAMVVYNIPSQRRGVANSTFLLSSDIAFGIGAIFWGNVASYTGYRTMFATVIIPAVLGLLINVLLKRRHQYNS